MKLKFNEQKFIEQAKAIYGADVMDECQRLNSREIVKTSVVDFKNQQATFEYVCPEIANALHMICDSAVGDLQIFFIGYRKAIEKGSTKKFFSSQRFCYLCIAQRSKYKIRKIRWPRSHLWNA